MGLGIRICSHCRRSAIRKTGRRVGPRGATKFYCPDPACQAVADVYAMQSVVRTSRVKDLIQTCVIEQLGMNQALA